MPFGNSQLILLCYCFGVPKSGQMMLICFLHFRFTRSRGMGTAITDSGWVIRILEGYGRLFL